MTRAELIAATKVKLEEISPFEEPSSFIIAAGDADYDKVKPITSYIDDTLDKAAVYCLTNLPASLLGNDIEDSIPFCNVDGRGIGRIPYSSIINEADNNHYLRLIRVECRYWKRACTTFITTEDPLYLLQQNKHTRGGTAKPIVVINPKDGYFLDLYSFKESEYGIVFSLPVYYIKLYKNGRERTAESINSPIGDYIALQCAAMVSGIMGNPKQAAAMRQEYNTKLESILH